MGNDFGYMDEALTYTRNTTTFGVDAAASHVHKLSINPT